MSRIDYYRAVLLGVVVGIVFIAGFYVFTRDDEPMDAAPVSKFEVVDTYNDRCDVVRYTPTNAARYYYFLDCKDK